mgnify:CR=1 FL=1
MNTTLIIMAAGIGSRFGEGIKQLAQMGPNGEIIMDYSIHDAKEAGFNKVVFIIRKDIFKEFEEIIGNRIKEQIDVEYVFQEIDDLPEGFEVPEGRTKPWGTGQAVLACKGLIKEPFAVINADDYYGKEAFVKLYQYMTTEMDVDVPVYDICMAGFILSNTLSENGGVTRGVCTVDGDGYLQRVTETYEIRMKDGELTACDDEKKPVSVNAGQHVSMNMWGLPPRFLELLEGGFAGFLDELGEDAMKKEYLLPKIIDKLLAEQKARVKVLETGDRWFGVTYKEDKPVVMKAMQDLKDAGKYPQSLWED